MSYLVDFKKSARKDLDRLSGALQNKIISVLHGLEQDPRPLGVRKMAGSENTFRIRVGDYRIIYEVHDKILSVLVIRIGNRREVYR